MRIKYITLSRFYLLHSHFVPGEKHYLVGIKKVGIEKVGIKKVGIEKVGIKKVGIKSRYKKINRQNRMMSSYEKFVKYNYYRDFEQSVVLMMLFS